MKKLLNSFILSLLSAGSLTAGAADFSSQLSGANLRTCNIQNTKCIEVKFQKAEMSQWTELFAFSNYEAIFKNKKSSQVLKGHFGYFDFVQNKIVLRTETTKKEILIDLSTLDKQEFSL